jgi:PKD repeat protein
MSRSILSPVAARWRAAHFPLALAVVALSLLAAVSDDAPAKEDSTAPSAEFATATANPAANSPVRFTGGPETGGTSWLWDFGDGSTSKSPNPVHSYANPGEYPVTLTVTNSRGSAASSRMLSVTASDTLRLIDSHPFDIVLTATDPRTGATGTGQVVSQNDIYGIFSIPAITGNAGNPEVIVKMVDATGIGQNYWVFYVALTDLTYTLSVREAATGTTKSYSDARVGSTVCGKFDTSGFLPPSVGAEPAVWSGVTPARAQAETDTLTLLSAHPFTITLSASDPRTGATGQGQVIDQNDIFGIFSIPEITGNAGNPEVIVKMVDASGIGQNYWVFYAALTDLNYTLAIEETATGNTKTYNDERIGATVCGKFDTSGFVFTPTPTVGPPTSTPTPPAPTPTPTPSPSAAPPSATPTPTPTAPRAVVVSLVATDFQWSFDGGSSNFTMHVGQTYELHISDGDPIGRAAHGFGGVPGLGIPARALQAGGAATIITFTPGANQTGTFLFSCDQPSCGSGHSDMLGAIQVTP